MTTTLRNANQINTILMVYSLEIEKIKKQIHQINDALSKKKISLEKFHEYAASYAEKCHSFSLQTIQMIKNNQAFYQNLVRVIDAEKNDLVKLEKIKQQLSDSYRVLSVKIEGLNNFCAEIHRENRMIIDTIEENECLDLSVIRGIVSGH